MQSVPGRSLTPTQNLIIGILLRSFWILPTSPKSRYNNPNKGIQKLTISLDGVQRLDIPVVFSPVTGDMKALNPDEIKTIGA